MEKANNLLKKNEDICLYIADKRIVSGGFVLTNPLKQLLLEKLLCNLFKIW